MSSKDNLQRASNYIGDPKLKYRLRQLLDDERNKYASVDTLVDILQSTYSDYGRKKKAAFRKSVQKAYQVLCKELELEHPSTLRKGNADNQSAVDGEQLSDDGDFSEEEYMDYPDTNAVNSLMSNMYKKVNKRTANSAPVSASSSPKRPDIGSQAPDLGKSLFLIDRKGKLKNTPETSLNNYVTTSKNNDKEGKDDIVDSTNMVSPMEIERSFTEKTPLKSNKEDDVSIKSATSVKKKRKVEKDVKKKGPEVQISSVTFADVGGIENTLKEVCKLLVHMKHPEVYQQLGVTPPRGFLLHGPPGCGKTLLANAIAGELQLSYIKIAATEVVSGVSGESEEKLRDIFDKAIESAPCVLFIDEIDSITQKRENASKDMERRIVAQLLTCMDELNSKPNVQVLVIGATNRPDSIDPALRRAGRFDREISMGIPGESARQRILEVLCKGLKLTQDFDFLHLARNTPGFVGADLMALAREAAMVAVNRIFNKFHGVPNTGSVTSISDNTNNTSNDIEDNSIVKTVDCTSMCNIERPDHCSMAIDDITDTQVIQEVQRKPAECSITNSNSTHFTDTNTVIGRDIDYISVLSWLKDQPPLTEDQLSTLFITQQDFDMALKHVQPSAKREGFATIPDVTWDDIGALKDVREELEMAILAPVRYPEQFKSLGLTSPPGILLAGPPGCGKTLLAKAVANESGINFISVKGPELLNMYVGESERAVRQVFQRARNSVPCVIFFDELDALCPRRSGGEAGSSVRVVNQLLTEMDGLEERKQVFIMAATNRPDIIDPAILRPGRLDKQLYVGLPEAQDRCDILNTITKNGKKPKLKDVNLLEIASDTKCKSFTGADLAALVREASVIALKEHMKTSATQSSPSISVSQQHFQLAFSKIRPSVSEKDLKIYEKMRQTLTIS